MMRIDVIDHTRGADQIMALAFGAQRMIVQERGALRPPPLRAVERTRHRIALAGVVLVALTLLAPANRAMDRWADGNGVGLDDCDDGAGNDNARDGSSPSQAPLSRGWPEYTPIKPVLSAHRMSGGHFSRGYALLILRRPLSFPEHRAPAR